MTSPLVVFPDACKAIADAIRSELELEGELVPVGTKVPNPRPPSFVLVRRTGGVRRNVVVDEAQITVEAWAATEEAAHDLSQLARGLVHRLAGTYVDGVTVYRVAEFAGPALLPDPLSDQPRYSFTMLVGLRGVER